MNIWASTRETCRNLRSCLVMTWFQCRFVSQRFPWYWPHVLLLWPILGIFARKLLKARALRCLKRVLLKFSCASAWPLLTFPWAGVVGADTFSPRAPVLFRCCTQNCLCQPLSLLRSWAISSACVIHNRGCDTIWGVYELQPVCCQFQIFLRIP